MRRAANWIAVLWTVAVGAVLLHVPFSARDIASSSTDGRRFSSGVTYTGIVDELGGVAYVLVALPVLLALAPMLLRGAGARRRASGVAAATLGLLALVGATSVGIYYVPAVFALAAAAGGDARPVD